MQGFWCGFWGLKVGGCGVEFRDWDIELEFRVWGLGFGVWGLGFGVWGLEYGVWGSELRF